MGILISICYDLKKCKIFTHWYLDFLERIGLSVVNNGRGFGSPGCDVSFCLSRIRPYSPEDLRTGEKPFGNRTGAIADVSVPQPPSDRNHR
jgi:hypothetical protein